MRAAVLGWKGWRVPANGCAWVPLAVLGGLGALFAGSSRASEAWHWCLTQDHEALPGLFGPEAAVAGIFVAVLLLLAAPLSRLPGSAWWLWPVLLLAGYALAALYAYGMGAPADVPVGVEPNCDTMPRYPFGPSYFGWLRSR